MPFYDILKILIEGKVVAALPRLFSASFLCAAHNASFLIIRDTLLEEICFACERDILHDY